MSITDLETLSEGGRLERLRYRHRDFYLTLADEALEGLRGPDQAQWRKVLANEYDNLVHAFQWSVENQDAESALRLAITIARALRYRGDLNSGEGFLRTALDLSAPPSKQRVKALIELAEKLSRQEPVEAMEIRQQALDVAKAVGDDESIVDALTGLGGWVSSASRQTRSARKNHLEEALTRARDIGYDRGVAEVAWRLSQIYRGDGLHDEAARLDEFALQYYRKVGDAENVGWMLYQEAWGEPDPYRSKQLGQEGLHLARQIDDLVLLCCCYEMLLFIDLEACGDPAAARGWLNAWERELTDRPTDPPRWYHDWHRMDLAYLDLVQGRWHDSRGHLEQYLESGQRRNEPSEQLHALALLARVDLELEGYEAAQRSMSSALEISRATGIFFGRTLARAASIALDADDLVFARELAEEALKEYPLSAWEPHELMCLIEVRAGNLESAKAHLDAMDRTPVAYSYVGQVSQAQKGMLDAWVLRHQGTLDEAAKSLTESIQYLQEHNHSTGLAQALEQSADLHAVNGDNETAITLIGAGDEFRRKIEYTSREKYRVDYQNLLSRLRREVSEEDFEACIKAGAQLSLSEAVKTAVTFDRPS